MASSYSQFCVWFGNSHHFSFITKEKSVILLSSNAYLYFTIFYLSSLVRIFFYIGSIIERLRECKCCRILRDLARPRAYSWLHGSLGCITTQRTEPLQFPASSQMGTKPFPQGCENWMKILSAEKLLSEQGALNNDFSERRLSKHRENRHVSHKEVLVNCSQTEDTRAVP